MRRQPFAEALLPFRLPALLHERLERAENPSLALPLIIARIEGSLRSHVLDLGPALGPNVDFFSRLARRLTIADSFQTLLSLQAEHERTGDGLTPEREAEALLAYDAETRFDVVFAWDLLNYFKPTQLAPLVTRLGRFCRQGSLMFALIGTRPEMPARPRSFRILDRGRLLYETSTAAVCACPLYEERDLARSMPGFRVENTFLLRNGMKEFIFSNV